jgi:hypothetical protein
VLWKNLDEISSTSLGTLYGVIFTRVKPFLEEEEKLEIEPDFARTLKGLENGTHI